MYDLVIEGGTIVDGTGAASCIGSVYIQGDRIACVKKEVSATQNVVGEPVGALNRFYSNVVHPVGSRIDTFFRTLKQRNRPLSVVFKYTLALGLLYLLFF